MSIRENIEAKQKVINAELEAGEATPVTDELQQKAVAAILGGAVDWEEYMKMFGKTAAEMGRLRPEPNDEDNEDVFRRNLARAYLVGNGNCGAASPGGVELLFGVDDVLDYKTNQKRP